MAKAAKPLTVVVMGVSGSGKSTLAAALADALGGSYIDGDSLHPPENIAKMSAGNPLQDNDRQSWLLAIRDLLKEKRSVGESTFLACSALKPAYRKLLSGAGDVTFLHLDVDRPTLERRMRDRGGHFMPPPLDSQLQDLELSEECLPIDASQPISSVIHQAQKALETR